MFSGSGTNYKMLEYMSLGLPVVTTAKGARGLELQNGNQVMIAETGEFGESIRQLVEDGEASTALGRNARRMVEERYDYREVAFLIMGILNEAMAGK